MARLKNIRYQYRPGLDDRCSPNVIRGQAIRPNTMVTITNNRVDPCGLIVWITDGAGNEQSVWRRAIVAAPSVRESTDSHVTTDDCRSNGCKECRP